jgi:hypothetical protein
MPEHLLQKIPAIFITAIIALCFLLVCYGCLRLLHISIRWTTWIVATLLFIVSGWFSVIVLLESQSLASLQSLAEQSNALGFGAFLILVYALGQWILRGWYRLVKQHTRSLLVRASRAIFLFFRQYHQLFGWIVLATATAHMLYFIPLLILQSHQDRLAPSVLLTGALAWGLLVCLVGIGIWVERTIKARQLAKKARIVHFVTALVFTALVVLHAGLA